MVVNFDQLTYKSKSLNNNGAGCVTRGGVLKNDPMTHLGLWGYNSNKNHPHTAVKKIFSHYNIVGRDIYEV